MKSSGLKSGAKITSLTSELSCAIDLVFDLLWNQVKRRSMDAFRNGVKIFFTDSTNFSSEEPSWEHSSRRSWWNWVDKVRRFGHIWQIVVFIRSQGRVTMRIYTKNPIAVRFCLKGERFGSCHSPVAAWLPIWSQDAQPLWETVRAWWTAAVRIHSWDAANLKLSKTSS